VQPLAVLTSKPLESPTTGIVASVGDKEKLQPEPCLTVNVAVPTEIVPLRAIPVLASTLKPTAPLPLPPLPDVMWIHESLLTAFQPQPVGASTLNPLLPPEAEISMLVGLSEYVQAES